MMTTIREARGVQALAYSFERAQEQGHCAFIPYIPLGYPTPADTLELIPALQAGGADIIELGVPFSDPVADGPTIQEASQVALRAGMTPATCLDLVAGLRQEGRVSVPLLLMGYYNPIHSYGMEEYVRDCAQAGVDGFIVPDLPPEEAGPLQEACQEKGMALVFLVAPTTQAERIATIADTTRGFLYVVSRLGITGTERSPETSLISRLDQIRPYAKTPIVVGFGISAPEQARGLAPYVDGVVVGSAIVRRATEGAGAVRDFVASFRPALAKETPSP
ncbi:MAG: tryptophan synthase subunit alpha [Chloroflexota bacterium]|nr:tryptophan synthase subunit alpha [Chloroflexota bacterium]